MTDDEKWLRFYQVDKNPGESLDDYKTRMTPQLMKMCYSCNTQKWNDKFHKAKTRYDGLSNRCKNCSYEYYRKNKDQFVRLMRNYYEKNKEKLKARQRERYQERKTRRESNESMR